MSKICCPNCKIEFDSDTDPENDWGLCRKCQQEQIKWLQERLKSVEEEFEKNRVVHEVICDNFYFLQSKKYVPESEDILGFCKRIKDLTFKEKCLEAIINKK